MVRRNWWYATWSGQILLPYISGVVGIVIGAGVAFLLAVVATPLVLAIAMGIAGLALALNVALLLPVFGALCVMEGASSAPQRYTYKAYFQPRGGQRRLFRMAPLHYRFELGGWPESTVIVHFLVAERRGGDGRTGHLLRKHPVTPLRPSTMDISDQLHRHDGSNTLPAVGGGRVNQN